MFFNFVSPTEGEGDLHGMILQGRENRVPVPGPAEMFMGEKKSPVRTILFTMRAETITY